MHKSLLLVPLLAACSSPQFRAAKTVDQQLPIAAAQNLLCKTHNGSIEVTGDPTLDVVEVHADIEVRGYTQEEADANLSLVTLGHRLEGDTLHVFADYDRSDFGSSSPSMSVKMRVPAHLALELRTHNGHVHALETTGPLVIETHNGGVRGIVHNRQADVVTHNGSVDLELTATGDIGARVITHNGRIDFAVPEEASGWLDARTHNGSIRAPDGMQDRDASRRHVRCRLGAAATEGSLELATHNGSIEIRHGNKKPN